MSSVLKWVIPVVLFVVIVGALAWLSQNLTKGPPPKVDPDVATKQKSPIREADLRFLWANGVWDVDDPAYAKEFEMGTDGSYDFPFHNPHDYPVKIGFARASCDCSHLLVTTLDAASGKKLESVTKPTPHAFAEEHLKWVTLGKDDKAGVEIPPGGWGLARLEWHGRKNPGDSLRINIAVWTHPAASPDDRLFLNLSVPVMMREAVQFYPDRLPLGTIGVGGTGYGEALAWSATRGTFGLKVNDAKTDALFEVTVSPLDPKDALAYRAKLQQAALDRLDSPEAIKNLQSHQERLNRETRILSAYRINVALREQKDGKQIDQGHFSRPLPVVGDAPFLAPVVSAFVRGDVDVAPEDGGKVNLKTFSAKNGIKRTIPISSDGAGEVVFESAYPKALEVKLTRNVKDSTPTRSRWSLDVWVPPGAWYGPFNDDATIILRTQTTTPRRIRIPVVGNGGQG